MRNPIEINRVLLILFRWSKRYLERNWRSVLQRNGRRTSSHSFIKGKVSSCRNTRVVFRGGKYFNGLSKWTTVRDATNNNVPRALTSRRPDFNLNAFAANFTKVWRPVWRRRHPALSKKLAGKVGRVHRDVLFLFVRGGNMLEELVADVIVTVATRNN